MLRLRRGVVSSLEPLTVRVGVEERPAWADEGMVGELREGDEVVVNVEALDLGLGSGGFDIVHANLTRVLEAPDRCMTTPLPSKFFVRGEKIPDGIRWSLKCPCGLTTVWPALLPPPYRMTRSASAAR